MYFNPFFLGYKKSDYKNNIGLIIF